MGLRITDMFENMNADQRGAGYISLGNEQYPNLITIFFGIKDRPSRSQAEAIARRMIASDDLQEACA